MGVPATVDPARPWMRGRRLILKHFAAKNGFSVSHKEDSPGGRERLGPLIGT